MKNYFVSILTLCITSLLLNIGCENDYPDSVWSPTYSSKPQPIIQSIDPVDSVYSAIGEMTITGQNFSAIAAENHISFNGIEGTILSATETEVVVRTSLLTNLITPFVDSVRLKLQVDGAFSFGQFEGDTSETYYLTLKSAAREYGDFDDTDAPSTIAGDNNENLYIGLGTKVFLVEPDSLKSEYSNIVPIVGLRSLRYGPGGFLFFSQSNFLLRIAPDGNVSLTTIITLKDSFNQPEDINDIDFDQYGNLYGAGKNGNIYKIDVVNNSFSIVAAYDSTELYAVRVYDNWVYTAGNYIGKDSMVTQSGVWRNAIQADTTLGVNELVLDWYTYSGIIDSKISALTFSNSGDMYIGSDLDEAVTIYSSGIAQPLYESVLYGPTLAFTWGNDKYFYVLSSNEDGKRKIVKVDMIDERSAPYYGRQ